MQEDQRDVETQKFRRSDDERNAFLFYASFLDAIDLLDERIKGKIAMQIIQYGLGKTEETAHSEKDDKDKAKIEMFLRPIKEKIDTQKRRYKNKQEINKHIDLIRQILPSQAQAQDSIKALRRLFVKAGRKDIQDINKEIKSVLPQKIFQAIQNANARIQQPNDYPTGISRGAGFERVF